VNKAVNMLSFRPQFFCIWGSWR